MTRKLSLATIWVSLLGLLGSCAGPGEPPPPPPPEVLVAGVLVRDVPVTREWVGEARGLADIEIRARVQGFLEGIHFEEGTRVRKGQLLYTIDPSELEEQVNAAKAGVAEAETLLANAEADVRRYRPLAEMNAVSQRDLDNAVARRDATRSEVEAAQANLRYARINLSYAEISSPMDGIIGLTQAKVGDFVGAAPNPVVLNTVSDVDPILVRFAISEREYLALARAISDRREEGKRIGLDLILADGTVHDQQGHVETIDRQVNASTGTLTVQARFPNPGGILRPGQYGKVRAVVRTIPQALLVPQRAVQELQGQYQVWVVADDDSVEPRFVEPGLRVDDLWVIDSGLEDGDRIVVEGFQRVRSGMTVSTKPFQS